MIILYIIYLHDLSLFVLFLDFYYHLSTILIIAFQLSILYLTLIFHSITYFNIPTLLSLLFIHFIIHIYLDLISSLNFNLFSLLLFQDFNQYFI
jgi:hypothetical protein